MARTLSGNFTGQAAHLERMDQMQKSLDDKAQFTREWYETLERLKDLDPDWKPWYDGRPEQSCGEMLPLMKERIELFELKEWTDEEERDRKSETHLKRFGY